MKSLLRRLDYCDQHHIVTIKGKVACEISAADEILVTDLIFSGVFKDLEPNIIAAFCSCFVFTDTKGKDGIKSKNPELDKLFNVLIEKAEILGDKLVEQKINIDKD
jgi:ATP-dependent RNA helicase DOB1